MSEATTDPETVEHPVRWSQRRHPSVAPLGKGVSDDGDTVHNWFNTTKIGVPCLKDWQRRITL
jgi:hypothetical protein